MQHVFFEVAIYFRCILHKCQVFFAEHEFLLFSESSLTSKPQKNEGNVFSIRNKRIRVMYPAEITSNQYLFVADYKLLFELSSKFAAKVPRPFCVSYNTNEQKVDLQDFNSNKLLPGA